MTEVGAYVVTLFRRGKVWWIQFRSSGQRVRESLQTENRKLADELRVRREQELQRQRLGLPPVLPVVPDGVPAPASPSGSIEVAPKSVLVSHAEELARIRAEYGDWSTGHKRPKTILNDRKRLDAFFATVKGKALGEVRTVDVERFLTAAATAGRSPATRLRHREILHAFWRWACRQGYCERNIVADVPRPKVPERDPVFLSLEQVDALLGAVAGSNVEAAVAVAVFAGLRREELCWLTWDDVDLDAATPVLRVRAKTIDGESWQPKTKRDRKVPVSPRLLVVLKRHRDVGRAKGVRWLLPSPHGCRWDPDNLSATIRELLQAAGLSWNLLQLRHTFGSQLARRGVSLLKIARLMGNSPAIASRHYINLVPEEMADEVAF